MTPFRPMRLLKIPEPFDHPDFVFEPKLDGFRALAHITGHYGEICCLEPDGRTNFHTLLFRRDWPHFYAFDLLSLNGEDLRHLPLLERKRRLRRIMPAVDTRLLYLDHLAERGCDLFRVACERNLEGLVGKWARGTYQTDGRRTCWLKIKNPTYSQMERRRELFEQRRDRAARRRSIIAPDLVLV